MNLILTSEEEALFKDNCKLSYYYVNRYGAKYPLEFDDMVQLCNIGLIRAIKRWDKQQGALSTFAFYYMRCELQRAKHKLRPISGTSKEVHIIHNDLVLEFLPATEDVANKITSDIVFKQLDTIAKKVLTAWQYRIFTGLYIEGYSQKELSEKYGLTKQRISQMSIQIKQIIKQRLDKEEQKCKL